jgi:hypothetical protein
MPLEQPRGTRRHKEEGDGLIKKLKVRYFKIRDFHSFSHVNGRC